MSEPKKKKSSKKTEPKKKKTPNSKAKGARFERELSARFRDNGYSDARRTAQYCGNTGDASDVVGLPGIHVEAKHQETMRLYDWMAQAKRDAEANGKGHLPVVFHKKNNAPILVTMELDDWFNLYREFEAGFDLKGSDLHDESEAPDTSTNGD